jgi:hypothetical protein
MRPISRGPIPEKYKALISKEPLKKGAYRQARLHLEERIGRYCSYCEMPMPDVPDVGHILPKRKHPKLISCCDNFLLVCTTCNRSYKGKKYSDLATTAGIFLDGKRVGPEITSSTFAAVRARVQGKAAEWATQCTQGE